MKLQVLKIRKCLLSISIQNAPYLKELEIGSNFMLRIKNGITSSILGFQQRQQSIQIQGLSQILRRRGITLLKLSENFIPKERRQIYYFLGFQNQMEELSFIASDLRDIPYLLQNEAQLLNLKKLELEFINSQKQILVQKWNLKSLRIRSTKLIQDKKLKIVISHLCSSLLQINLELQKSNLDIEFHTSLQKAKIDCNVLFCRIGKPITITTMELHCPLIPTLQSLKCFDNLSLILKLRKNTVRFEFNEFANLPLEIQLFKACKQLSASISKIFTQKCGLCNTQDLNYSHMDQCKFWNEIRANITDLWHCRPSQLIENYEAIKNEDLLEDQEVKIDKQKVMTAINWFLKKTFLENK